VPANYSELATLSAPPPSFTLCHCHHTSRSKPKKKKIHHLRLQLSKRVKQDAKNSASPLLIRRAVEKPSRCRCAPGRQGNGPEPWKEAFARHLAALPDSDAPAARRCLCVHQALMTSLDGSENSSIKNGCFWERLSPASRDCVIPDCSFFCWFLKCSS